MSQGLHWTDGCVSKQKDGDHMPMGQCPVPSFYIGNGNWELAHWRMVPCFPASPRASERVNELESGIIPLLEKEGWMRDQENVAKQP